MTPSAVSRSRDLESEATRRAILDAAEHLLASRGEAGLSIREVCARAGVTPPTIYHHFGDKAALVDRAVDECFEGFDRAFAGRAAPVDPVERLRWGFDRYLEYGVGHPTHYRLMFQRSPARPTPGALASYDRLRRMVAAVAATGRLAAQVEDATAAFWTVVHGATSLVISGFMKPDSAAIRLVRDAILAELTRSAPQRTRSARRSPRRKPGRRR
ncbi:MAG TPA: TetR/AcrR family transcriptional regulator [Candidatus Bathyarchaeia archaeon]|nr:TetR/AcrR family transcriptional regulator [Candidatus Bathyarchaeia archaeon]